MNHYVVTRTVNWRFQAENWNEAKRAIHKVEVDNACSDEWEMIEVETDREETLNE